VFSGGVRVIGKEVVVAKLAKAEANILANNLAMTQQMLEYVKAEYIPQIPVGPGHFGYHLRDRVSIHVRPSKGQLGTKVVGVLKTPMQGYWREFGTGARHRSRKRGGVGHVVFGTGALGSGGERAYMTAHKALAGVRKFIRVWYGTARWWHV